MMTRFNPEQKIIDYFGVTSILESSIRVVELGDRILVPKMPVPTMGYFAVCMYTESNVFGLQEADPKLNEQNPNENPTFGGCERRSDN